MANFYNDNKDLQFYVDKGIDWQKLYDVVELEKDATFADVDEAVEFYRDMLGLLGEFAAEEVAPRAAAFDRFHQHIEDGEVVEAPELYEIYQKAIEIEMHRLPLPREFGGMNAPLVVNYLNHEMLARGDVSVMTHFGFHSGIAMALLVYSVHEGSAVLDAEKGVLTDTPYKEAIEQMATGAAWGAMDITEAGAGSDMAAIRTQAVQDKKGNWSVTGEKIFITSGHGKYHIVIARTEDAAKKPGLEGLSLFLVETYKDGPDASRIRKETTLGRVDEKIGHHGSATCVINFDKSPARLLGKRGEGFKLMLMLMNNARIGVSFESIGLCESALRMTKAYAAERVSMEKTIDQHEMIADMLDEMQTDIQGIRAMAVACAFNEEIAQRSKIKKLMYAEDSEERKALEKEIKTRTGQSRLYTPLLKYLAAEKAVEMGRRAIQIHGGAGYTTECGAEKLLRDALVLPIYEGTSQIQSLMATKDNLLWIMKNAKEFAARYARAVSDSMTERDPRKKSLALLHRRVYAAQRNLMTRIVGKKAKLAWNGTFNDWKNNMKDWDPKRDFAPALLHAEKLTRMLADVAICDILFEQGSKHAERMELFDRYLERALPRSRGLYHQITTTGDRILGKLRAAGSADKDAEKAA